jgi:hypothetical protein
MGAITSLQVIDGDQYTPEVIYGAGRYTFTREKIGTRYVSLAVCMLVDPNDPEDIKKVHALQDAIKVEQPGGPGRFEVANWDQASQKKVRDALLVLGANLPETKRMFGPRDQVDPVRHLIGTAMAFGGNPEKDALYLNITPGKNDSKAVHRLNVPGNVPVDAFWSVIVYNATGHLQKNQYDAYSFNSVTAKRSTDGSIAVQFGGCDGKIPNCLPIMPGWNYMVRLYRPRSGAASCYLMAGCFPVAVTPIRSRPGRSTARSMRQPKQPRSGSGCRPIRCRSVCGPTRLVISAVCAASTTMRCRCRVLIGFVAC